MSKLKRRVWMVTLVLVLSVVVVLVVGRARARDADAEMLATWRTELGGQTFLERFPARPTNRAAVELDRIVAPLGVDLLGLEAQGQDDSILEVDETLNRGLMEVRRYLTTLHSAEVGHLPVPPLELQKFRQRAEPVTEAIIAALGDPSLPEWSMDLNRGFETPIPNFLGQLQVVDLLVFEAMEQQRTGNTEAAWAALEAGWRLSGTAREMPYLISQLIANAQVNRQMMALRRLCEVPPVWGERLRQLELRQGLTRAFYGEAWVAYHSASLDELPKIDNQFPTSWLSSSRWLLRDHARRLSKLTTELSREPLNTFDPTLFAERAVEGIPRWQTFSRHMLPNLWDSWSRTTRISLGAELTALVIEERARLASGGEAGSSEWAGSLPSSIDGLAWQVHRIDGTVTISLDGDLVEPQSQSKHALPLTYTIHRGECSALS